MKNKIFSLSLFLSVIVLTLFFSSCKKEETPTKTKMEGVWMVTAATDDAGQDILSKIKFPIVAFHLSSDNTVISTAGPMIMYIVYGGGNYATIAGHIDQVFGYASLDFNGGEFFVGDGTQPTFTLEMKLEGLPGQKTITTLLSLLGLDPGFLEQVIYHKFMDVKVEFNDTDDEMYWTWDNSTTAVYNKKDQYGNYVLWGGWPVTSFQKCSFTLKKESKELRDLVQENS
jgi:hypothetical protein